jgi:ABC-type dipeptide/oligopeptide/nickel transport system permease component
LTTLVAVLLLGRAGAKFAHVPSAVTQLAAAGISGDRLTFVAILEALSALLFLFAATRSAGLLFVSAFLGGAIATHVQHAESIVLPSLVLGLAWFGAWLRYPEILWAWTHGRASRGIGELK